MLGAMSATNSLWVAAAAALVAACGSDKGPTTTTVPPTTEQPAEPGGSDNQLPVDPNATGLTGEDIAARVQACWEAGDAGEHETLVACYRDDAAVSLVGFVPQASATGGEGALQIFAGFGEAFPDLKHHLELTLVNGHQVVVVALAQGTNTGSSPMMPVTGKKIGMRVAQYLSVDDDGLAEIDEHYLDQLTMMGQLDVIELPARPVVTEQPSPEVVIASNSDVEAANLAAIKRHGEAFDRHDVDDVMELYADDAVLVRYASPEDDEGKAAIADALREFYGVSSDVHGSVEWMFAAGDYVAARLTVTGTNDGPLPPAPIPATNKTFTTNELDIYRFRDGLIIEHHMFSNALQFATQLGLVGP